MKTYDEIEKMILGHIKEIDDGLHDVKNSYAGRTHYSPLQYSEMYKAKSLALQALVDLKDNKMSH